MRHLGITVEETGILYILLPVTQLICTPLAGMIADKFERYKDVLMLSVLSSFGLATAMLFVPPATDTTVKHPDINLHCGPVVLSHIVVEKCRGRPCDAFQTNLFSLEGCSVYCPGSENTEFVYARNLCGREDSYCFVAEDRRYPIKESNYMMRIKLQEPYQKGSSCLYRVEGVTPILFENTYSENNIFKSTCPIVVNKRGSDCTIKCSFQQLLNNENETFQHINQCTPTEDNRVLTVWLYFLLHILFNVFASVCLTLLDSIALTMIDIHGGQYGRQRFWAILAQVVFTPVTGFLIELCSKHRDYVDYSPAFYIYDILAVGTATAIWMMRIDVLPPTQNFIKSFKKPFKVTHIITLLIVVFWLGMMWGFVESFLFWYLIDLESSNFLLELTLTIGAIVGLPLLCVSDWLIKKAGKVNILLLALFFYFIRSIGYSYIYSPWWSILFEAMEAFTYHLMWVTAATYGAELAPQGLLATIQGCIGGFHYGAGRSSGIFAGGTLMIHFGARLAFRIMGIASCVMFIVYGIIYYFYLRKKENKIQENPSNLNEIELNNFTDDTNLATLN